MVPAKDGAMRLLLVLVSLNAFAFESYYGRSISEIREDRDVRAALHKVLSQYHVESGGYDRIVDHCVSQSDCYRHRKLSYRAARVALFGELHLERRGQSFSVRSVYCQKLVTHGSIGPGRIPNSRLLNTEHTWPQSRFSNHNGEKGMQKSDLHALFPAIPRVNSQRGNHAFSDVEHPTSGTCDGVRMGRRSRSSKIYFEPPH